MLPLDNLVVMQEDIREQHQMEGMIQFILDGGHWTDEHVQAHSSKHGKRADPIYISQFEDGMQGIHDGHHRVTASFLAGRHSLRCDEFVLKHWPYSSYNEVAPERNYFTPFHPKHEVRLPEFFQFKAMAKAYYEAKGFEATNAFVLANKHRYAAKRRIRTVAELAAVYTASILKKGAA